MSTLLQGPPIELVALSALVLCILLVIAVWRIVEDHHQALGHDYRRRKLRRRARKVLGR